MHANVLASAAAAAVVIASASAAAAPAQAQATTDSTCLLVTNLYAIAGKEEGEKRAAQAGLYFYLGRTDGHVSTAELRAEAAKVKKLSPPAVSSMMKLCMEEVQRRAKGVQAVMQTLRESK